MKRKTKDTQIIHASFKRNVDLHMQETHLNAL